MIYECDLRLITCSMASCQERVQAKDLIRYEATITRPG